MPSFQGDHDARPALSDEQFAKLVELLTPGYELSKIFLAQHKAQVEAAQPQQAAPAIDQPPAGSA